MTDTGKRTVFKATIFRPNRRKRKGFLKGVQGKSIDTDNKT